MLESDIIENAYKKIRQKLEGSIQKPTEFVEIIIDILEELEVPVEEISSTTRELYIKLFQDLGRGDLNQARQSWVVASGNNFENLIRGVINVSLNDKGILAIKGDRLKKKTKAKEIVEFLTLRARRRCTQTSTGVWPDSDIIILTQDKDNRLKTFALISCKTSDHSRNDSVMFWALALRETGIKYCMATMDLDDKFKKNHEDKQVSGHRKKAEAYLDRVYSTNPNTSECSQVLKINLNTSGGAVSLLDDLIRWRKEIVPNFSEKHIGEEVLD